MERTLNINAEGVGEGARKEMDFNQQSHWEDKRECQKYRRLGEESKELGKEM